ncbi:hypothetical protein IGI04_020002 [Brassica rapa subsp. trilocularis]|uniref:Uncharacterized protein n=1 Tax=Brassica rapa subsp. trilocularis TaxID=1813537 RepID=A0ABQ7MJ57_BRACM|nr:hypothetical protein IGI04_020002 [Brassica rapa subsp. trilocularis]
MTRKIEALDTHVMTLDTQVSQTTEAMKIQEALVKGKAVESERYQVDDILDNDFGKVDEHEKLEEEPFLVESSMSIGSSHWCRLTPSAEHRSTFLAEHRSTLSFGHRSTPTEEYVGIVRIQRHSELSAGHPHPPIPYSFKTDDIDRHHHDVIDRQQERSTERHQQASSDRQLPMKCQVRLLDLDAHCLNATWNPSQISICLRTAEKNNQQPAYAPGQEQLTLAETCFVESVDRRHQPSVGRHQMDGHEPVMERQATKERISIEKRKKSRKPYIPNHLRREVQKVKLNGFHKRVKRVPKDMSFEVAYHKYGHGNLFLESRETYKYIELLFNKVSCKSKRALKNEQDPGKFLIPFNIMAIDTAKLLGLKIESSQDSFTFVDNSKANSTCMIKNVKVEIGECIITEDFHVVDNKSGKTSLLPFGRAFMATVGGGAGGGGGGGGGGAICDLKKNKMCLINVDEIVFYDPVEKKKSEEFISCIEMFEDIAPPANSNREPAKPASPSLSASVNTLQISKQTGTKKSKSGGRTKKMKKKKKWNEDSDFMSLVPSQCKEESLEYRVRCRGGPELFTKVRVLCYSKLRLNGQASARTFVSNINKMRKRYTQTCFGACSCTFWKTSVWMKTLKWCDCADILTQDRYVG